jgi:hypothetical protein
MNKIGDKAGMDPNGDDELEGLVRVVSSLSCKNTTSLFVGITGRIMQAMHIDMHRDGLIGGYHRAPGGG